jgi:hypothetical protein
MAIYFFVLWRRVLNRKRPHSSLDGHIPDHVYFGGLAGA